MNPTLGVYVGIGLLSGAVIAFQLALLRVFSFTIWHHFTFMVISVALLGFGIAGVILRLRPSAGAPAAGKAALWSGAFGVSGVLAVLGLTRLPFDPIRITEDGTQLVYLAAHYLGLAVPFTFAGLAVVTLLAGYARSVGKVYGADLVGAGAGAVLGVLALGAVRVEGALLGVLAAGLGAGAALAFASGARKAGLGAVVATFLALGLVPLGPSLIGFEPGPSKSLWRTLHGDEGTEATRRLGTGWDALTRVDVVENGPRIGWTVNPVRPAPSPEQTLLVLDGDASTAIIEFDGEDMSDLEFLGVSFPSAALRIFEPERVLVVGAGGGIDVLAALYNGAEHVDAVEISPVVIEMVTETYAERGGAALFERDDVDLYRAEGRAFVRSTDERYDVIQLSLIDTFAATASGAFSLAESYLYTVEAFADFLDRLTEDGALTITRWGWVPPRETLRLCTVAEAALRRIDASDPARHVVVLGSPANLGSVLVKRTPFRQTELARIRRVAERDGFTILHAPGVAADNAFSRFFRAEDRDAFIASYPYDVSPTTDDRPYFFQFGRWSDVADFAERFVENPIVASGRVVLLAVLVQALVLSAILLAVPLMRDRRRLPSGTGNVVGYFLLVGLAFMLVEITLMQKLALFLGSPVHATATVLATLLAAAGAGSALAPRLVPPGRRPLALFVVITGVVIGYALFLPSILRAFLGWSELARISIAVVALAPVGFVLGVPFPSALGRLERRGAGELVGVAWAANGFASVIGPVVATLLALDLGVGMVLALGGLAYLAAFRAFGAWWTPDGTKEAADGARS